MTGALLSAALVGGGCAGGASESPDVSGPAPRTAQYRAALQADIFEPASRIPTAVIVLVPGGGWLTADPSGLASLARSLADAGALAVTITYRAGSDGVTFPTPLEDVRCALGFAATQADPGVPLVVVGHSAGGHLAALAALSGTDPVPGCPHQIPRVDGLAGLAGVYDTGPFAFALVDLFGSTADEDPATWRAGDPISRVRSGSGSNLSVLLLHGDDDESVPVSQSKAFAAALESQGRSVRLVVLRGVTHDTVYSSEVAAGPLVSWLDTLTGPSQSIGAGR